MADINDFREDSLPCSVGFSDLAVVAAWLLVSGVIATVDLLFGVLAVGRRYDSGGHGRRIVVCTGHRLYPTARQRISSGLPRQGMDGSG